MRQTFLGLGVLALLGVLYGYLHYGSKPLDPVQMARTELKTLDRAVTEYCIKRGEYPPTLEALVSAGTVGPDTLQDPWKHEFQYDPSCRKNKGTRPDIWTVTPAREVIGNWGKDTK